MRSAIGWPNCSFCTAVRTRWRRRLTKRQTIQRGHVTKLLADHRCETCGGVLVPPEIASTFPTPARADYICLRCGRPYHWVGQPPRLMTMSLLDRRIDG